jgi:mRNA interferase RelE/StbE
LAYRVEIHRTARKQLLGSPQDAQKEIAEVIDSLEAEGRPSGCKKLRDTGLWRVRTGRYRIIYSIDDDARVITVVKIAVRREDTYKGI